MTEHTKDRDDKKSEQTEDRNDEKSERNESGSQSSGGAGQSLEPPSEEMIENAKEELAGTQEKYDLGARPTVVLPGSNGTISGTAFADMVDENGELKDEQNQDRSSGSDDKRSSSGSEDERSSAGAEEH